LSRLSGLRSVETSAYVVAVA